jgi:hypothetical protein
VRERRQKVRRVREVMGVHRLIESSALCGMMRVEDQPGLNQPESRYEMGLNQPESR